MHPIKRALECEDPKCKCDEWLAKQTPMNLSKVAVSSIGPQTKGWMRDRKHGTNGAYNAGCRCVRCKEAVAMRQKRTYNPAKRRQAYLARKSRLAS